MKVGLHGCELLRRLQIRVLIKKKRENIFQIKDTNQQQQKMNMIQKINVTLKISLDIYKKNNNNNKMSQNLIML